MDARPRRLVGSISGGGVGADQGNITLELAVSARRLEELVRQRGVLVVRLVMTELVKEHKRPW